MARKKAAPAEPAAPMTGDPLAEVPKGYGELLEDLKARIRATQVKAALSVNRELIGLYWHLGEQVVQRQDKEGWGRSVIERLAKDLRGAFPDLTGFSPRNLWRMRAFYLAYTKEVADRPQPVLGLDGEHLPQAVAEIPWGHNAVLLEKLKDPAQRLWYAQKTSEHGWSRAVLVHQIDTGLYERQGQAITNFASTLPPPQSDLAGQLLKDPYNFEFLTLAEDAKELQLQRGLLEHLRDFLLELGVGFAYVGSRYHLVVGGEDYYLDLLFYHLRLRAYVVIELKVVDFEPEHAGKMNFYLSAVDDLLRHPQDQPSIGLILCQRKNRIVVEYSLRDTSKPMGVASYQVRREALPQELRESLPSVERLEEELGKAGESKAFDPDTPP